MSTDETPTFSSLGLEESLLSAIKAVGWKNPTEIQAECIPYGIEGRDVIGLAQTGSGKTGAFCIPILNKVRK